MGLYLIPKCLQQINIYCSIINSKYLTKTFNKILTTTQIPSTWDEAKVIIIYKKGDPGDIKKLQTNQPPVS